MKLSEKFEWGFIILAGLYLVVYPVIALAVDAIQKKGG